MSAFSFSVDRLKGSSQSLKVADGVPKQSIQRFNTSPILREVARSDDYRVLRHPSELPNLTSEEAIFYGFTDDNTNMTVLITSDRILIYDYTSGEIKPLPFEFSYTKNEHGILPQVKLIKSGVEDETSVLIIDSVEGTVRFIDSVSLAPSLDILNKVQTTDLKLSKGEFVTISEYFESVGVLVATNTRRVLLVSLSDQLGRSLLSVSEVHSPRSFLDMFFKFSSYNLEAYDNANKIISLKSYDESDINKHLYIQEEDGDLIVLNYIKNNSILTVAQINLKIELHAHFQEVYSDSSFIIKVKDLEPLSSNQFLVLVFCETELDGAMHILYNVSLSGNSVVVNGYTKISSSSVTDKYPKLYTFHGQSIAAVVSDKNITLTDMRSEWEDFINFKSDLQIYGHGLVGENSIIAVTESGLLRIEIFDTAHNNDPVNYVKSRIEQALQYQSSKTPLSFQMMKSNLRISESEIESAISKLSGEISLNESKLLAPYPVLETNIEKRCEIFKNLCQFVSENFTVGPNLKQKLINTTEQVHLTNELYKKTVGSSEISDIVNSILQKRSNGTEVNEFFDKHAESVVELLTNITGSVELHTPGERISFGEAFYSIFSNGYISIEKDIKWSVFNSDGNEVKEAEPIFVGSIQLLENVNELLKNLVSQQSDVLEQQHDSELKTKVSEIVLNLSLFLYYATKSSIQSLIAGKKIENERTLDRFTTFLNSNREGWIKIFVILRKQDQISTLVEGFQDLESLCEILDSERELESQIENPILAESFSVEVLSKLDDCFERFGYEFAEPLFSYYVRTHKINILLGYVHKYPELVETFLNSNPEHSKFAWILDIENDQYLQAANKLTSYVSQATNENIENKKLQLNLAKLSLYALDSESEQISGQLDEIEVKLQLIELQNNYKELLLSRYTELDSSAAQALISKSPFLIENHFEGFQSQIASVLEKMGNSQQLELFELVQLLTLLNFDDSNYENFNNLFKLLSFVQHSSQSRLVLDSTNAYSYAHVLLEKVVWRRLLLTNDWESLMNGIGLKDNKYLKIVAGLSSIDMAPPSSVSDLVFTREDLKLLGVPSELVVDFEKENGVLAELDSRVDLGKWINRTY